MNGFLVDTNVLSELTRPAPAPAVIAWFESVDESLLHLSVLTLRLRNDGGSLRAARAAKVYRCRSSMVC